MYIIADIIVWFFLQTLVVRLLILAHFLVFFFFFSLSRWFDGLLFLEQYWGLIAKLLRKLAVHVHHRVLDAVFQFFGRVSGFLQNLPLCGIYQNTGIKSRALVVGRKRQIYCSLHHLVMKCILFFAERNDIDQIGLFLDWPVSTTFQKLILIWLWGAREGVQMSKWAGGKKIGRLQR